MKTYRVNKREFERVLHGNRSIAIQKSVKINEWIMFLCTDYIAYSQPIQARVKNIYKQTFKTYHLEGVSQFPFPIEE